MPDQTYDQHLRLVHSNELSKRAIRQVRLLDVREDEPGRVEVEALNGPLKGCRYVVDFADLKPRAIRSCRDCGADFETSLTGSTKWASLCGHCLQNEI